ncbi:MAG: Gfo/Idh/MocA family oxidoreductase [Sphingomonas sp.]|uniref:Gfo/Idh/MocA family protein n=1 Tax=Sphingomonas sp. TaxID=28214 RepID=UPI001ACC2052|nr:Gfo/Idh/MocA family oxidoreductase [Sphingomonas sp.]MBN8808845.1 Gfo/Idh/MocA family oxidoreductase [Sphingomonas sp.]
MTPIRQQPLRAAVIGCGAIAYEHLPFVATSPLADLVAVCDMSPAMAAAAGERFGAGATYTDVATLLAQVTPDIVHVLTPPHTHDAIVRQALAAGAHVVCEKPMTGTEAETAGLIHAADLAGKVLVESRNLLWNDAVIALRKLIADGRLGRVAECDVLLSLDFLAGPFGDRNLSGRAVALPAGAVHDFLPHLIYLFEALSGVGDEYEARGFLQNRTANPRAGFDHIDALIDDGRVRGRLRIATDAYPEAFRVVVRGTEGTAETDLYNPYLRYDAAPNVGKRAPFGQVANGKALRRAGWANLRNKIMQHGTMHGLPRMLEAVYRAIIDGTPPPITATEMIATARMCDRLVALADAS